MKKIILSIATATFIVSSINATSLRDSIIQTIDANPAILSEKFNKEAFKKYIDQEKGDYLPTLDFEAYADKSKTQYNLDNNPNRPDGEKGGWNSSLKFEQVLYDGGVTPSEVEEFEHKYYANRFRSDAKVETVIRGTVDSYLDLVKSQELLNLSELNINRHKDYLKTAQEKEAISGEILESYQVNSKKHFIIDRYLEQEDQKVAAENKYKRYTQKDIKGNICRPEINQKLIPDTLEKTIEVALTRNYKVLEQIEKAKEQRENIVQANAENLPTLKFQLQASWDDDLINAENGREDTQRARLILNWNLFNGFKTKASKQREILFLQEQQKLLDDVTAEVIQDVTKSYNAYFKAKQRIDNSKKFVEDNKNIKDVYVKQLADGTRTFVDILNAESELYRSQITLLDQEYNLYGYYYDLLENMGLLSESILKSKNQVCSEFVTDKYESKIKKTKKIDMNDELNDVNLLNELGETTNTNDQEIANIINSTEEIIEPTAAKDTKKVLLSGKYTINIATLDKNEDIETYLKDMGLSNNDIMTYNMSLGTKVLYGSYDSLKDATMAMTNLNSKVLNSKVYVDYLEKHRKLLEKYTSIN
jgi:adhesin transport system outer membrane protein